MVECTVSPLCPAQFTSMREKLIGIPKLRAWLYSSASYKDFDHSQWWESIEKKILCIENLLNKIFFLWESIQKNILSGENPLRKKFSALRICWIKFSPSENLFTKYSLWWESIKKKILCIENLLNKIFSLWEPIQKIFSVVRIL